MGPYGVLCQRTAWPLIAYLNLAVVDRLFFLLCLFLNKNVYSLLLHDHQLLLLFFLGDDDERYSFSFASLNNAARAARACSAFFSVSSFLSATCFGSVISPVCSFTFHFELLCSTVQSYINLPAIKGIQK